MKAFNFTHDVDNYSNKWLADFRRTSKIIYALGMVSGKTIEIRKVEGGLATVFCDEYGEITSIDFYEEVKDEKSDRSMLDEAETKEEKK